MLRDSTDGSPQYGPFHKSMFNGMFFSCHHYPLCLLSSGCLMSAELVCTCHIEFMACNLSCTMGVAVSWELLFLPPSIWWTLNIGVSGQEWNIVFPGFVICFGFMRVSLGLPDPLPAHEQFPNPFVKMFFFSCVKQDCFSFLFLRCEYFGNTPDSISLACDELSTALLDTIKGSECAAIRCLFCIIVAQLHHCCWCSQPGLSPLRGGSITEWQPLMSNKSSWFSEYWRGSHHTFMCMLREQR